MRIAFLHTAASHVDEFARLVAERGMGAASTHRVDETLLADAIARGGIDDELRHRIVAQMAAAARGADALVCTCSTIAGEAEAASAALGVPFVRVDRPMAERAIAAGSRVAVVAALASTVLPTRELLIGVAGRAGRDVSIETILIPGAWEHFESGDMAGYWDLVAGAAEAARGRSDAVILAQASMAPVAARFQGEPPVLCSPALAVDAALGLASGRVAGQTAPP